MTLHRHSAALGPAEHQQMGWGSGEPLLSEAGTFLPFWKPGLLGQACNEKASTHGHLSCVSQQHLMVQSWFLFPWDTLKTWVTCATQGRQIHPLASLVRLVLAFLFSLSLVCFEHTCDQKPEIQQHLKFFLHRVTKDEAETPSSPRSHHSKCQSI